ncbi:type IV secretion protein Rhs, partial [Rothia mucilaginosa]
RFTAPDPLVAPVGAGWGADPFSLVGGNPVSLVDPWGLSPVSVEDFEKYREQKASSGITGWVRNNWEYVAGGAMVIAGAVIGAVAAGTGPLGGALLGGASGALMGAGMSVIEQKASGGKVDWSKVGQEAGKGFVSGAIAGAVTGGLSGLKNLATGVTKIATATKAASATKSTLTSYGSKLGSILSDSKVLEDVTKEALSGGINNVASYYMDDTVKDKSVMGGVGMFFSGSLASAGAAGAGGIVKTGFRVKGYVPEVTKQAQKVPENFVVRATKKTGTIVRDATIDTGTGTLKNGIQYSADTLVKGQEFSPAALKEKTLDVIGKDFIKNTIKGSVKMDSKKAEYYRFTAAHTYNEFRVNPGAVISRVASNANERTSTATNQALTWMIGIDISKLKI